MDLMFLEGALLRVAGPADRPLILAVAGFGDDGSAYAPLFKTEIAAAYRFAAIDMPGFGCAPPDPAAYGLTGFAARVNAIAERLSPSRGVILIGHSVAGPIVTEAAHARAAAAVISIEGNLVLEDAYFSGQAAHYDDAAAFKDALVDELWELALDDPTLRRFAGAVARADAMTLWRLGRDVRARPGNYFGERFLALDCPNLHYWSEESTTKAARLFLRRYGLNAQHYPCSHHWPMTEDPATTSDDLMRFLSRVDLG